MAEAGWQVPPGRVHTTRRASMMRAKTTKPRYITYRLSQRVWARRKPLAAGTAACGVRGDRTRAARSPGTSDFPPGPGSRPLAGAVHHRSRVVRSSLGVGQGARFPEEPVPRRRSGRGPVVRFWGSRAVRPRQSQMNAHKPLLLQAGEHPAPMTVHGRGSGKRRTNRASMTIRGFHDHWMPYVDTTQKGRSCWIVCPSSRCWTEGVQLNVPKHH